MKRLNFLFLYLQFFYLIFSANSDIRLNSLGFLPNMEKKASVITNANNTFEIKRASDNVTVYTGNLTYFGINSDTSETIYIADFTNFTDYGSFYLSIPGVGNSFTFQIQTNIYQEPFYHIFKAFYLWRCGCSVSETFSGNTFSHNACHLNDGYLDYVGGGHTFQNGTGGWHDAGDYGKYVVNAGVTMGVLFKAWEHFKDKILLVNLNIPNVLPDDNLYPDYLKELRWEVEWLKKMQAVDGKVYHKLTATNFEAFIMPEYDSSTRYFVPYSTAATADFTAIMAMAARIFEPYDTNNASDCLNRARVSYAYLTNNPTNVYANDTGFNTGGYQTDDTDDRLWAAAEMWETTGENVFLNDFETRASTYTDKIEWSMDWDKVSNLGMFTYYSSTKTGKNSAIVNDIINDTLNRANSYVANRNSHGYGRNLGASYWWGSNGAVARCALTLQMANIMQPNSNYLNTILDAIAYLAGRNYYCRSFITGLGINPPLHPHHRPSGSDGIDSPWPGYLVGGPSNGAKNWVDDQNNYETNEVAINWNSALVYAMAGFIDNYKTPTFTPTVTGTPPTQTITPTITVTLTPTQIIDSVEIIECEVFPNPNTGKQISFKYKIIGYANYVNICIYTFGERKIIELQDKRKEGFVYHITTWKPKIDLANGLYYYTIEFVNANTNIRKRKVGAFYIIK